MSGTGIPLGLSCIYGGIRNLDEFIPDNHPTYIGSLVVDVPFNAKGSYTIHFDPAQTFLQNDGPAPPGNLPWYSLKPATITVPCGRCCSGYEGGQVVCTDRVAEADCGDVKDQVFSDGELCPKSGGPACAECASNADCDDGIACTTNRCTGAHVCEFVPAHAYCNDGQFCNGNEVCNATAGCQPGEPPCADGLCDEVNDECLAGIPTVSNWGLVVLALALLVMAKVKSCTKFEMR